MDVFCGFLRAPDVYHAVIGRCEQVALCGVYVYSIAFHPEFFEGYLYNFFGVIGVA